MRGHDSSVCCTGLSVLRLRFLLLMVLCGVSAAACSGDRGWLTQGDSVNDERTDPYVKFTQAVAAVEPLISPELEALSRSQNNSSEGTTVRQGNVALPKVEPLNVEENLAIATSPQLLSLNEQMYEQFVQAGYRGMMDINAVNTNQAIRQFCQQSVPGILTISRPMTPAEVASCQSQQRSPVGIPFGKDALVLVTHQQNDFLRGITLDNLRAILTQTNWSAIQTSWPQRPIVRYLMGPDSSTVSSLATTLFNGSNSIAQSANTQYFDDEESMIQSLSIASDGIGIISYATFQRSPSVFKTLPINGITASPDTISQDAYLLDQTLYLYVDQRHVLPQLAEGKAGATPLTQWVHFYLAHINETLPTVSLLPLTAPKFDDAKKQWLTLSSSPKPDNNSSQPSRIQ